MSKHTPGDWTNRPRNPSSSSYSGYEVVTRAKTKSGKGGYTRIAILADTKEAEANAKLLAAAPDLLEALCCVVRWHREHDSGAGELFGRDYVTTSILAIAKAEGHVL